MQETIGAVAPDPPVRDPICSGQYLSWVADFILGWEVRTRVKIANITKTRVNDHATFFDFVLGHIWFLVIMLGHTWFVWILGSHKRTIYDFLEIIQGSYKKISRTKNCIIFMFYWSWKNFWEIIQGHIWNIKHWLAPQIFL